MEKLLIIAKLIPVLIDIIKAVEEAIPGSGKGEAKLAAIRGILEATVESFADLWPSLVKVVSTLVALFNTTGVFKKGNEE